MTGESEKKGLVFDIQKFAIHDGDGIRTLIFMKGCPLNCIWCSNPESQFFGMTVMDVRKNCIGCGKCADKCPVGAIPKETLSIDRALCNNCGLCCLSCFANAKKTVGKWMTVDELIFIIEKDRMFYRNSGGGITIGGGEPLMQKEFVEEILLQCRQINIHSAIETSGYGNWREVKNIFAHVDQVLYDIKHMDNQNHYKLTGVGNKKILENAERIVAMDKNITFRIPLIPGYNDDYENIRKTGEFVKKISRNRHNVYVEILPFHSLGKSKYGWIGSTYKLPNIAVPREEQKQKCTRILKEYGCKVK